MLYKVLVAKSYHHRRLDGNVTVYGTIAVEADSFEEAQDKVEWMMNEAPEILQTCDPRIEWEEDTEELTDDGWEYSDWSFLVCDENPNETGGEMGMKG